MDEELIKFTAYLDKVYDFERVTFIHIAKSLELPKTLLQEYPDLMAPVDETIEKQMIDEINGHFEGSDAEIEFKVEEGHPEVSILKWTRIKDADLLILGKKKNENGAGVVPSKVGRAAPTSVLILPEGAKRDIKKILIPIDFSDYSKFCLERAIQPAKELNAELILEHVYEVPIGYTKTGKSFEEFAQIMLKNAKGHMHDFLNKHGLEEYEDQVIYRLDIGHDPSDEIMQAAREMKVDLIIIGSRGRSDPAAFFLGSLAEKLVQRDYRIPVLVDKPKGKIMHFLQALMNI